MHHVFKPHGICPSLIEFDTEDNRVYNVKYTGGCNGNLQAVSKLVDGLTIDEVNEKLAGIKCGFKSTSCADQLTIALAEAKEK